jgi:ABC-2 type transport system ATP-binding protein
VDDVTLDVAAGEIFGLLGPNGAGKTTIFKMLATMIAADTGTAIVAGHDIARNPSSVRERLAIVPADERSLNWRLTAAQNLDLFAALQHVPRRECASRVARVLATVGLGDSGMKRVSEFSSGMRQRLLIARALLTDPKILLLDEPTRTLDPLSAQELRRFLREQLAATNGCTILLATHNTDEAFSFCDRVAVLNRGHVLAVGAARMLAARYGDERYRLLLRGAVDGALGSLEAAGLLRRAGTVTDGSEGWKNVECQIAGEADGTATVLHALIDRGVEVARLERIDTSLAELIARIITANGKACDA